MAKLVRRNLSISELAPGGLGVGHVDFENERRAVFVSRSAPGDVLDVDVDFSTRPARGTITRIEHASSHRVTPPCAFFDRCGGCDYMHITPEYQQAARSAQVANALRGVSASGAPAAASPAAVGEFTPVMHAAAARTGARVRARLHAVADKRGNVVVGFFEERSHEPVSVDTCIALHPELDRVRALLPALLSSARGEGEVGLALGPFETPRPVVLDLSWKGELPREVFARFERAVNEGMLRGSRVTERGATRPAIIGDPTPYTLAADGAPLALAPGGFAQATESLELGRIVTLLATRALSNRPSPRILELYAGAGNFTVALARLGDVVALESDADACEKARENLSARGLRAKITCADAAEFPATKKGSPRTDLVVLDPPRTGARAVATRLAKEPPRHVLYVSCDPQTLARDAAILNDAFAVVAVHAVECFPSTSHVESVILFERRRAPL